MTTGRLAALEAACVLLSLSACELIVRPDDVPGQPDLTLPKRRAAILVFDCTQHPHPQCATPAPTTLTLIMMVLPPRLRGREKQVRPLYRPPLEKQRFACRVGQQEPGGDHGHGDVQGRGRF